MAISKMVILVMVPLNPKTIAISITTKGAKINLYNKAKLMCFNSLNQPPNFNCNPIENKANGPTVPASLSNNESRAEILIKCGMVKANTQPISGGKVDTF